MGKAFQGFYCYSEDRGFGEAGGGKGCFGGLRFQAIGGPSLDPTPSSRDLICVGAGGRMKPSSWP